MNTIYDSIHGIGYVGFGIEFVIVAIYVDDDDSDDVYLEMFIRPDRIL